MLNDPDRFLVLTGAPGSGKTTLIEAVRVAGFATAPEAGRGIIRDQVAIGGPALPWQDRELFAELMQSWELRSWHAAHAEPGPGLLRPRRVGRDRVSQALWLADTRSHRKRRGDIPLCAPCLHCTGT